MFMCRQERELRRSQHAASRGQPTRSNFTEVEHDKNVAKGASAIRGMPSNYQVGSTALFLGPVFVACSTKKLGGVLGTGHLCMF